MTDKSQIKIRDLRQKEKYLMDDEYMNGYARLCGWQATITYCSLCRHANKDQFCFPSVELMAYENRVDRKTIMKGLQSLQDWNIVQVQKERTKEGTFRNNTYVLLDKSQWKPKPNHVPVKDMDTQPSPSDGHGQEANHVPVEDTKETHIIKETHTLGTKVPKGRSSPFGNQRVNFLLEEFQKRWGYPPTDFRPRQEAWNLTRRIESFIKERNREPTEENFRRVAIALYGWIEKQNWGENIQNLSTIRRKSVIFLKPKGGINGSNNQEAA